MQLTAAASALLHCSFVRAIHYTMQPARLHVQSPPRRLHLFYPAPSALFLLPLLPGEGRGEGGASRISTHHSLTFLKSNLSPCKNYNPAVSIPRISTQCFLARKSNPHRTLHDLHR